MPAGAESRASGRSPAISSGTPAPRAPLVPPVDRPLRALRALETATAHPLAGRGAGAVSAPPPRTKLCGGGARSPSAAESPVLGNDAVEQVEPGEHVHQLVEFTAGDQDQLPARLAEPAKRVERRVVDLAVVGKRPVVVGGEGEVAHR